MHWTVSGKCCQSFSQWGRFSGPSPGSTALGTWLVLGTAQRGQPGHVTSQGQVVMKDLGGRDSPCLPWSGWSINVEIWNLKIRTINMCFIGYKNRLLSSCTGSEKCECVRSRAGCLRQATLCSFSNMPLANILFFFFFNVFYFSLHCLNHLNRRAPLWGSLR